MYVETHLKSVETGLEVGHPMFLGAAGEFPGFGGDFEFFAFLDEEGDFDFETGFELGIFDGAGAGVAADCGFGLGDDELYEDGELQADGVAVVLVKLEQGAVHEEIEGIAEHLRGECEGLVGFLVEEVGAVVVGVQVGGGDELEVGLGEALLGLEGLVEDGSGDEIAHFEADESLASACSGGGDVGVEAGVGCGLELEHGFALDVDCFNEGCHGFQYTDGVRQPSQGAHLVSNPCGGRS